VTIRARLALAYGAAIAITLIIVGVVVWFAFGAQLRSDLDRTLATRAAIVTTSDDENRPQIKRNEAQAAAFAPDVFVALFDADGHLADTSGATPAGLPSAGPAEVTLHGHRFALWHTTTENGLVLVTGAPLEPIERTQASLAALLAVVGLVAALASIAAGWWLARRALQPVDVLTVEAGAITADDLDRRLPEPSRRDEVGRLASTLNSMLDRLAVGVRRQRAFVAAASHDLRTPISALAAELELADQDDRSPAELRAAIRATRGDVVRLGALASALLELAAADPEGRPALRTSVELRTALETMTERVASLAQPRGVRVTLTAPEAVVEVDPIRLEQAVTNLLVNAITYSPPNDTVALNAALDATGTTGGRPLRIEVLDHGTGVPAAMVPVLFEPFQRGTNAVGAGAGLGLATAAAAVRAQDGRLHYERINDGLTRFWFEIPV
jgi:two-component system OmpR family sensor kinase